MKKQKCILGTIVAVFAMFFLASCASKVERCEFIRINCGMTEAEVRDALGNEYDIDGYGAGYYDWWYDFAIVSFIAEGKVIGVSVPKACD